MCTKCVQCPRRSEEVRAPGTGVTEGCERPCGRWEPSSSLPQQQWALNLWVISPTLPPFPKIESCCVVHPDLGSTIDPMWASIFELETFLPQPSKYRHAPPNPAVTLDLPMTYWIWYQKNRQQNKNWWIELQQNKDLYVPQDNISSVKSSCGMEGNIWSSYPNKGLISRSHKRGKQHKMNSLLCIHFSEDSKQLNFHSNSKYCQALGGWGRKIGRLKAVF